MRNTHTHRERERERERQSHRQREKQVSGRKPDVGLNPRTLGLHPEPKADAQLLSHPGVPDPSLFYHPISKMNIFYLQFRVYISCNIYNLQYTFCPAVLRYN
ncbi:hypothetical protein VULLAG_LOCUS12961 [Vulpes lagopus]